MYWQRSVAGVKVAIPRLDAEPLLVVKYHDTRIMIYKGMVYKSKYWIFEKNKGVPVSIVDPNLILGVRVTKPL